MASIKAPAKVAGKKAAIIGGGPTGIAAAYFLGRAGIETTIFEREAKLGGVPRYVIPAFRISDEAIDKDVALMERYGVEVKCGAPAPSVDELKKLGYTHILIATGAWQAGKLDIPGNVKGVIGWMKEMKQQVEAVPDGSCGRRRRGQYCDGRRARCKAHGRGERNDRLSPHEEGNARRRT